MKNRLLLLLYILLSTYLGSGLLYAQENISFTENPKFKSYTIFDGLPSTSVTGIAQDIRGFMWFATRDGLSRFNGLDFTNYYRQEGDSLSLSHNQIQVVFVDSRGSLWVGTKNGLNQYIEGTGFKRYFAEKNDKGIAGNGVLSIREDREGKIWLGTNNGITALDPKTNKTINYRHKSNDNNSLQNNYVMEVYPDSKGYLWVITDQGVDRMHLKTKTFKHYALKNGNKDALREVNYASALYEDNQGQLWVGNLSGLWRYSEETDEFLKHKGENDILANLSVRAIDQDSKGNLLIGAYSGLYVDNFEKKSTVRFRHNPENPYSISSNSVHAIFADASENLWFGTWAGGINYLGWSFDSFNHIGSTSGLGFPIVSSFAEDADRNLWIGTEGGGFDYYERETGNFTNYNHNPDNSNSLSHNNVHDLVLDGKGNLILATFGGGLDYFDPNSKSQQFQHYVNDPQNENSVASNYILTLFVDSKARIWVGTSNAGLNQFHPEESSFTRFSDETNDFAQITAIYEDRDGRILVGTSSGLGVVDGLNKKVTYNVFEHFNNQIRESVLSIHQDEMGDYWLASEGEGLVWMDAKGTQIKKFQKLEGLSNDLVYGILPDEAGNLWLSTHNGISRFNVTEKSFDNFDVQDGLQSNEFNFDAFMKTSQNELVFGGINGFNIFLPSEIKINENTSPVLLTNFKINEKPITINENSPLTKPLAKTERIILDHDQSLFSFEFIALKYSRPEKINYAYKLEGFNDEWLNIGDRRQVTFTNIAPGDYTFKVKASKKGMLWNDEITSIALTVRPPWWKTGWAILAYLVLLSTIGYAIWHYIRLRIKDRNALKKVNLEREKDEEMHELKLQFFTNVSHELRTPLTLIMGPLEKLIDRCHDFDASTKQELTVMERNAKRLMRQVNNIMDFRKDEMGKLKLKAAKGNFAKFCNETCLSFRELADSRNITYKFSSTSDAVKLYFDRDKMEIVLYNLLSNAFKFTPDEGEITVRVTEKKADANGSKRMVLSVSDTGQGISETHLAHIFERFYQIETVGSHARGSGIGLALTKRLVELHHGTIEIDSKEGAGTVFTIQLPKGKQHLVEGEIYKNFRHGEDVTNYNSAEKSTSKLKQLKPSKSSSKKKEDIPVLLVIEDNYDVRKFIVGCFQQEYVVKEASDGGTGYELATQLIPDLIISDVMMPEMDGISLCSKLKKDINTSHIPIILLTARTSLIFKKDGLENGADDYVNKPFTPSILQLKVKNLMDTRKRLQEYFIRNYKVNPKEVVLTSKDDEFLDKAVKCVEEHLSDSEFNVSTFIGEMGMSRSVLFRKIKGLTGQSTTEFIRTIRIKRAAQILVQNRLSISETAYEVGFNDLKYFRTCFRKQFNSSPSEFIAKNAEEEEKSLQD
ncbi:two-component regulator propeller domain-containing protein [Maribacter sp. 2210JD10-5]|uniref:hybrid sensor histidine kinase/response regulator transcription factor n=1 Tax=Maribacter sp. 2210JD10-5 TaxID=3386272 RepID=UPI0039BCCD9A